MPRLPLSTFCRSVLPRATLPARTFHRSAPSLASEVPNNLGADSKILEMQEKLSKSQDAVAAIANLAKVMQEKGVDTTKRPSPMQMMKLGMDADIRAAATKMMEECQKAGVQLDAESIQALASKIGP